jgi:EmrB/QacA subfamily drug resistance transporter
MNNPVNKRAALLASTLASFLTPFIGSSVNIALPSIGREFATDAVLLSWVTTAYLLAAATFLIPAGRIADIVGRKRIFTCGALIYTISSLLSSTATSTLALIACRVLEGTGGAMIFGTGVAILTSVYPVGERGKALGINVAATYLGLSLGPFLGGVLTQHFGWRSIFLAIVPLCLIIIVVALWKLPGEWAEARGEGFDFTGAVIYAPALIALICGFSLLPALPGAGLITTGALGILAFVKWETKATSPILDISLFRDSHVFAFSNLAALINYSSTSAVAFLLSLYLQYIKELSPQNAGLILISQPVVMAILSPLAGRLSDRIEPRVVASTGMALTAVGLGLFIFLSPETTLTFIMAGLIILGFGFALFSSPNTNAVMSSVEKKFYGVASATLGTMRLTGQMLGMGIAILTFALYIGRVQITPAYYPLFLRSAQAAFSISAVLCFAGIFASLARGKVR